MNFNETVQNQACIGFIGAGNMAEAMISGLIRMNSFPPKNILASDIQAERLGYMEKTYHVTCVRDNIQILDRCEIIVFAVKPQQVPDLLQTLSALPPFFLPRRRLLVISIAAGLKIETFEKYIYAGKSDTEQQQIPIIRVMPNTPALVGAGMCAFSSNARANSFDIETTRRILSSMGDVIYCDESKMDAVTAISGSGPAYCFYFMEAMIEAGENLGLTNEEAVQLTLGTFNGSVRLMESQGESASLLRRKVTSPGGTTEAAIRLFDDHKVKEALISAVFAAAKRSKELSGKT